MMYQPGWQTTPSFNRPGDFAWAEEAEKRKALEREAAGGVDYDVVEVRNPQGLANFYDDRYGAIRDYLRSVGASRSGAAGGYLSILENFRGRGQDLENFMRVAGPYLASGLSGSESYRDVFRPDNSAQSSLAAGSQDIGRGYESSARQSIAQRQRTGLGRDSASQALANQAMSGATTDRNVLGSMLRNQHMSNRLMSSQAQFDVDRQIAQLAISATPIPRPPKPSGSSGDLGFGVGALLGQGIGERFGSKSSGSNGQVSQPGVSQ